MIKATALQRLTKIWDTGAEMPWDRPVVDDVMAYYDEFVNRTHSVKVVRLRWEFNGLEFACPFPAVPLLDRTGVVFCDEAHRPGAGCKYFIVINADGSERFRIHVPNVDASSDPQRGFIELPSDAVLYGVPFGVPGNDGHLDYIFDFNWNTGELVRAVDAPHMRY